MTVAGILIAGVRSVRGAVQKVRANWSSISNTLASLERDVTQIRAEVTFNGGSSLRDAVSRVESELAMEREARRWTSGAPANYDVRARDGFLMDGNVSAAYMTLTGLGASDVADNGWLRAVHPGDRDRVRALALSALEEHDVFSASYRVRHVSSGVEVHVEHMARPVRVRRSGTVIGWVGCLVPTSPAA
jgi:PAS domain S-box-containing protein